MSDPVLCECGQRATSIVLQASKPVRPACGPCASAAPFYCVVRPLKGARRSGPRTEGGDLE